MTRPFFRARALASLLTAFSFLMLAASGLVLFFGPAGRVAQATGWQLLGLDRWQWADLHAVFALLMLASALPHLWMNRKPLLGHLRQSAAVAGRPLFLLRREAVAALALGILVAGATVWRVPPVHYVSEVRTVMRGTPGAVTGLGAAAHDQGLALGPGQRRGEGQGRRWRLRD